MSAIKIAEYTDKYRLPVIDHIVTIQSNELGVAITADDQPDLKNIPSFYQKGNGNFWLALDDDAIAGTIALIDIGNNEAALRKMFVDPAYRGKEKGVAQALLNVLIGWCRNKNIHSVCLGTIDIMKAAHRFYEKNGFERVEKKNLPLNFPLMTVDNIFYKLSFTI